MLRQWYLKKLYDPWLIYKTDPFLIVSKSVAIFILSHSSGNSSKISHIPPGILRKSLTFLGEFFENLSHSSGNSSKISHIPRGILRKSLTFLGEFSKKFCRVIEGRFIPSAIHGLFKSFDFGFIFLLERNCHIFQKTYQ